MKRDDAEPFIRFLQDDKAGLVRLHGALGEILDCKHGSNLPSEAAGERENIEADIRSTALRSVYRIDRARNSNGFESLLGHARTLPTILKHVATQMKPDSSNRFIVLLLEHHLETLLNRQAPRYSNKLPQRNAA